MADDGSPHKVRSKDSNPANIRKLPQKENRKRVESLWPTSSFGVDPETTPPSLSTSITDMLVSTDSQEIIDSKISQLEDAIRCLAPVTESSSSKPSGGTSKTHDQIQNEGDPSSESQRMIDKYQGDIRDLKTRRNTYSYVSTLPNELFHCIFVQLKFDALTTPEDSPERRPNWLLVNGVCRRWRQIALNTPWLWAHITLSCLDRAEEMFKRSKNCTKCYTCDFGYLSAAENERFWALAKTAMSDIQLVGTLDLKDGCPEDVTRFLDLASVVPDSALKLEALYLSVSDRSREYELQKTLLWTNLPSLRHLCLVNVLIPEELPLLPSLVFLQVIKTPDEDGYLSVRWLLSNLPKIPNVKDIDLARIVGSFDDIELPDTKVSLPSLQAIDLDCDDSTQLPCLEFIEFPSSTVVKLSVASFCDYYDDENFATLYNLWKRSGAEHIDLRIDECSVTLTLYDTVTALEQSSPRLTCQLSAMLDEERVALLDDHLPLSEVTRLTFAIGRTRRNLDFLSDLFSLLDGATTLKTQPGGLARIFKYIKACSPDGPPPLPALRVLDVDAWGFYDIPLIESFVEQCQSQNITITHIILRFWHPLCRTHWDVSKLESLTHVEWKPMKPYIASE